MSMPVKKELTVFDSTCVIVGIIIGAGIYETAPAIAAGMGSPQGLLAIWLLGGLLALAGSICYGELATTWPQQGGDFVYLTRAYGKWAGFLFGWSQMMIIRPGDIAMMAFIFARYATQIYPFPACGIVYAVAPIIIMTGLNSVGVKQGKWTQNLLTVIKMVALLAIVVAAMLAPKKTIFSAPTMPTLGGFELALILVMFTYGGWNEIGYVAAEIKNPNRNIIRALLLGVISVTAIYVLVNVAFLSTLGYEAMVDSQAVAVDSLKTVFPETAARIVSVLICLSCLGAINGLILTGARISYAVGDKYRLFRHLGRWDSDTGTPIRALMLQGLLSCAIVLLAGSFINTILYTAPLVWLFFLGSGCGLFVLRFKYPKIPRPFRVVGYPVIPAVFCLMCLFMLYNCVCYAYSHCRAGFIMMAILLLTGGAIYCAGLHSEQ